ncbi:hypothetical protein Gotri_004494, partial [Gossypium trilobum]|nr:hypothetical protein [Gossypium trilobum]
MHLRLDVDVHKLETEKLRKGKNKAEEDLDSLKIDYKKLRLSMRTEKILSESRNEKDEIKAKVAELEKTLHNYRNRNSLKQEKRSQYGRSCGSDSRGSRLLTDFAS